MTPHDKAKKVFDRIQAITLNRYVALECSLLFCDEMIKTFEAVTVKYSRDFQKSVAFWQDVKRELVEVELMGK